MAGRGAKIETLARGLAAAAAAVAVSLALGSAGGSPVRPNILLVSIDTLRRDHVHCYGYARETTPAIDALAREGVRFDDAISVSSWTLPAHVSLLTALPPGIHRVYRPGSRIPEAVTTLAEVLHRAGYATAGFVSGPFLRSLYNYGQGFDLYDDSTSARGLGASHRGITSPRLLSLVTAWLDGWRVRRAGRPFFLFVHMWDPHYDYEPPPPYDRLFDPGYRGTVTGRDFERGKAVHPGMDPRDLAHVIALYDGEIRFTDEHLGRLIAWLRRSRVLDDTIVVVTSDHGEEFFEHGQKGHQKTLYDELIRIPLVMRYPRRIRPGSVFGRQVRLVDVAPTILGLAGVSAPDGFGSGLASPGRERDLSPWLGGERPARTAPKLVAFSRLGLWSRLESARTPRWKVVLGGRRRRLEIYDLRRDPDERRDLSARAARSGQAAALAELVRRRRRALAARAYPPEHVALPAEHVDRLRALGYIR